MHQRTMENSKNQKKNGEENICMAPSKTEIQKNNNGAHEIKVKSNDEVAAATKIQAGFRGSKARKKVKKLKIIIDKEKYRPMSQTGSVSDSCLIAIAT